MVGIRYGERGADAASQGVLHGLWGLGLGVYGFGPRAWNVPIMEGTFRNMNNYTLLRPHAVTTVNRTAK